VRSNSDGLFLSGDGINFNQKLNISQFTTGAVFNQAAFCFVLSIGNSFLALEIDFTMDIVFVKEM
jgi:hypothetical protein